jgi:hypothetical protein
MNGYAAMGPSGAPYTVVRFEAVVYNVKTVGARTFDPSVSSIDSTVTGLRRAIHP